MPIVSRMKLTNIIVSIRFLFIFSLLCVRCSVIRSIFYQEAEITDYKLFPCRDIQASQEPDTFIDAQMNKVFDTFSFSIHTKDYSLQSLFEQTKTVAFIITKGDTLIYEKYFHGYTDTSMILSFSMSKSFFSLLFGIAIDEGRIQSLNQLMTDYIPELTNIKYAQSIRIYHLLQMTSGLRYQEPSANPFALHNRLYWGDAIEKQLSYLRCDIEPGHRFEYKSLDNQLLALILSRVLHDVSISEYFERKVWRPLGSIHSARWCVDANGLEKTFCCFTARAIDIVKLGKIIHSNGIVNDRAIISKQWLQSITAIDTAMASKLYYQYQWWIADDNGNEIYASGHQGQILFINRQMKTVILRMGEKRIISTKDWIQVFRNLNALMDK
ncbi:MAG: serine hydrolase [Chitinispirillaceae bacterium]|nr:serine hydrolase [Chitinispirillaceae bacterium]